MQKRVSIVILGTDALLNSKIKPPGKGGTMDIIREITRKITKAGILKNSVFNLKKEENLRQIEKVKMHGTTILALKCKDGVIMASDRRCVAGETIFSDNNVKIEELGNLSCIAGAGAVADFQILVETLRDEIIPSLEEYWDVEIFIDGQANLLKYLMRMNLFYTWPILAGWDPFKKKNRIFLVEPDGAIFEPDNYAASGSGEDFAQSVLNQKWSYDCSAIKGVKIAVEALLAAAKKDRNTSDSFRHPPIIKIISSEGIATLPTEKALSIAWEKVMKEEARKGTKEGVGEFIISYFMEKLKEELENPRKKGKEKPKEKKNDNSKP